MRLLVVLLIIAALIYFGWTIPFKERTARTRATITSAVDSMRSALQKHQDKSARRH